VSLEPLRPLWREVARVLGLGLAGCVSTDLGPSPSGLPCIARGAAALPLDSVVIVGMAVDDASDVCPGIVVAPSLVATAASCLFPHVGEWLPPNQAPACDANAGWSAAENGDFSTWIGSAEDVDQLSIYPAKGEAASALSVQRIYQASSSSRCVDDLALAFVPSGLPATAAALRLNDSTHEGEAIALAGIGPSNGYFAASESAGDIVRVTGEADVELPPRSLLLNSEVCSHSHGGGVFSAATGALIGLIVWVEKECDEPLGASVALRLAPYRRFLIQVAAEVDPKPLHAEGNLDGERDLQLCPE
jgi:hypothetical protein